MLRAIIKIQDGDVTSSSARHIAFLISPEPTTPRDFAYAVSQCVWPELERRRVVDPGTILTKKCGDKTYHALACYQPRGDSVERISEAMRAIGKCLEKIETTDEIALVMNPYNWGLHTPQYLDLIAGILRDSSKQITWYMR